MVNCRSEVNTPLRLNGRTMRSASTPSTESRSTMPSGWATIQPNRTPLLTRSARTSSPEAQARLTRVGANRLQVRGHFARQQLDEPCAHQGDRMALARERGIDGVELGAFEPLRDEDVGDVVAGAAFDRIVVAAEAGVRIGAAGSAEGRIDAALASGRDDRLRRLRPAGAVRGGELRLEQFAPALDEGGQCGGAGGGDRVEIEVRRKDALIPAAAGGGACRHDTANAPSAAATPKLRFMSLAPRCRNRGSHSPLCHVPGDRRKRIRSATIDRRQILSCAPQN